MRRYLFLFVLAAIVFRLSACQCGPTGTQDAGQDAASSDPLVILTAALPNAVVSQAYDQQLIADGGVPPIGWSFAGNVPLSLGWLNLSADGRLTGFPTDLVASPGASFLVQATDSLDASVQQGLALIVGCVPGTTSCYLANGSACEIGTHTCNADGTLTACTSPTPSTDPLHCSTTDGGVCSSCDVTRADNCALGTCQCGTVASCAGANANCCPGSKCADFNAPGTCGACTNDCHAKVLGQLNVDAGCVGGTETCTFACNPGFADCNGGGGAISHDSDGCEASLFATNTCGNCQTNCDAQLKQHAHDSCDGTCHFGCDPGWLNCGGGTPLNGCETNIDTNAHCGTCAGSCPVAGTMGTATSDNCSSGTCHVTCQSSALDCDGNPQNGCECTAGAHQTPHCGNGGSCGTPTCTAPFYNCSTTGLNCVDRNSDYYNCGACGNSCANAPSPFNQTCSGGQCSQICSDGSTCTQIAGSCALGHNCVGRNPWSCAAVVQCGTPATCNSLTCAQCGDPASCM